MILYKEKVLYIYVLREGILDIKLLKPFYGIIYMLLMLLKV